MSRLNITFCSFPDFSGNAKALYEYMLSKNNKNFNFVWIVYEQKSYEILKKKNINVILIGSDKFREYIKKTDVFFTTQGNLDGDKTDKSLYVELWHGIGPKPVGYACKNPSKEDIRGYNNMRKIFDYIIVPNDFWKIIFSAIFNVECDRIKSLGMPLFDYFAYSNGTENLSKVLETDIKKYKKIIMYMPTYKNGFNHEDISLINDKNIFNFEEYNEYELDQFLKENNYLLCVKRHPGDKTQYQNYESENIKNINEEMLIKNNVSVNEIINVFDMMITDYSSIGTEFLFFDRPILYAIDDFEEYDKNRGIIFSNIDFWTAGPVVSTIEDLINETNKLLTDDNYYKKEREEKSNLMISGLKNGGCEQIYNFLFDENGNINKNVVYYKNPENCLKRKLDETENINNNLKLNLESKQEEIDMIVNSKGWRILEKVRKIKNLFRKKGE